MKAGGVRSTQPTRARPAAPSAPARVERILARIRSIPEGFVSAYGDIDHRAPRLVGQILAGHPGASAADLPWHRVVRADGTLAQGARQRERLLAEGVPMRGERVDVGAARWVPEGEGGDADLAARPD